MRRSFSFLALGSLLVIAPLTAAAQTYPECSSEPSSEEEQAAKGAFMAGKAAFDEADYERAITYWSDAYRRDCTAHLLLQNLARAYELGGKKAMAIEALETYLERVPDDPKRDQFERRIEKLRSQLEAEAESDEPPAQAPSTKEPPASKEPPIDVEAVPPPRGKKPIAPLVLSGAGGLVAIVGGVGYLAATSKVKEYEDDCGANRDQCPPGTDIEDKADKMRNRQIAFGVTTWVGVGAIAGGVVWYLAAPRKVPETGRGGSSAQGRHWPTLEPVVAPGFGGLNLKTRF